MDGSVGITIEKEKIRCVVVSRKKDRYLVEEYRSYNRMEEGVWLRVKEVIDMYRKSRVIIAIDGTNVFTRVFKLPSVGRAKLDKIVRYEAQQQLPLPLEEVVWSYDILRRIPGEGSDIILIASREEYISNLYNELESCGITPAGFTASIVGLCELVSRISKDVKHSVMYVEMGYSSTNVVIIEGPNRWVRSIPIGIENFLGSIRKKLKVSNERAIEILKLNQDILAHEAPATGEGITVSVMKVTNRLIGELWRSIEIFSSSFDSSGLKRIYISGELLNLIDLTPIFVKRFKVAVERFSVDKIVDFKSEIVSTIAKERNVLPSLIGVAMGGFPDAMIHASVVPDRILRLKTIQKRERYLMWSTFFLILTSTTFSVYNIAMDKKYKRIASEMAQMNARIEKYNNSIIRLSRNIKGVERKLEILKIVSKKRTIWLELFSGLEGILPEGMWITGISPYKEDRFGEGSRRMVGETEDGFCFSNRILLTGKIKGRYQILDTFRNSLARLNFVVPDSVKITFASRHKDGIISFRIVFRIKDIK